MRNLNPIFLIFLMAMVSCVYSGPFAMYDPVESGLDYSKVKFTGDAKIFLIAGSRDSVNFSQEIIEQKKFWLSVGIKPNEIACYYVIPDKRNFDLDKTRYAMLDESLSDCYMANMKVIKTHLEQSAKKNHDYLYVYITSHGGYRVSNRYLTLKQHLSLNQLNECGVVDSYHLALDTIDTGTASREMIKDALCDGQNPDDILLTPSSLTKALLPWPKRSKKYIVLQGCYSGGFIPRVENKYEYQLADIPNSVVLTASRADRASFGCNSGSWLTYYGEIFLKNLRKVKKTPEQINWHEFHAEVRDKVIEKENNYKNSSAYHSFPQFYQSDPQLAD